MLGVAVSPNNSPNQHLERSYMKWDFTDNPSISDDKTFTRASTATFIDSDGLLKTAAINIPRYDYSTGSKKLLLERSATNLCIYSQNYVNPKWFYTSVTYTTTTLSNGLTGRVIDRTEVPNVAVYDHTNSVWILAETIRPEIVSGRVKISFTTPASCNSVRVYTDRNGSGKYAYVLIDVIPSTRYIVSWFEENGKMGGVQLESGLETTSYIPTNGSTVTRSPDIILPKNCVFTRSTTGTYVDIDGSIKTAIANEPRYDYTGGVRALLVEPSATNLLMLSSNMSINPWVIGTNGTFTPTITQSGVGPDGVSQSWLVSMNRSSTTTWCRLMQPVSVTANTYVSSMWIKAGSVSDVGKQIYTWVYNVGQALAIKPLTLTNQWVRIDTSAACQTGTAEFGSIGYQRGNETTQIGPVSFLVSMAQAEVGSSPTSYIPTVGSAVTRAADIISSINMSSIWNQSGKVGGTVVVDVEAGAPNSTSRGWLWSIDDGSMNRLSLRAYESGSINSISSVAVGNGSTYENYVLSSLSPFRGLHKVAVSYVNNDKPIISFDGYAVQVPSLVYTHNAANTTLQNIFQGFNGRVRSFTVYKNPVDAEKLKRLSSI